MTLGKTMRNTTTTPAGPDNWIERDSWLDVVLDPYVGLLGEGLVAGILAGSLLVGFWIHSDNIAIPSIIILLLGGVLSTVLPAPMLDLARSLIVIGLAAALFAVARTYVLDR